MNQPADLLDPAAPAGSPVDRFARVVGRLVPDAITAAVFLMLVLFGMALTLGDPGMRVVDAFYQGLWMLLPFTMQMTLIIVLSSVLGATPFFRRSVASLSRLPNSRFQVIALSVLVAAVTAYFSWGLGLTFTPLIAIHFATQAERKGLDVDFMFLLALLWGANACWQYGISSSAALLVATSGHFLESMTGILPLSTTIWSPAAIAQEIGYVILLIAAGVVLMPRNCRPISRFPEAHKLSEQMDLEAAAPGGFAERLERNSVVVVILSVFLFAWLVYHFGIKRLGLDFNSLNCALLFSCLLLHRNIYRFTKALEQSMAACWPVVLVYHLYGAVGGMIQHTSVGETLASLVGSISTPYSFPALAAIAGMAVSLFVPSSGGQWVIQGFVTAKAALAVGVSAQRGLLALGVGDHMGNLISPFWYQIVGGIARVNFREFYGYGLVFAALWFALGVVVFTFLPC